MYEHKLHYDFNDNKIFEARKTAQNCFPDVKILLPRKELCWNEKFMGELRLSSIQTFTPKQPVKVPSFIDAKTNFSICQDCRAKLPYNKTLKRCNFCRDKHHAKLKKERRELEKEKDPINNCIDCKKNIKFDLGFERCLRCRNKYQAKLNKDEKENLNE